MKKVLITGGNGFIGKHLQRFLSQRGYEIVAPGSDELNVTTSFAWEKYDNYKFNHVVHLAGKTFVPASWETPSDFFSVNLEGTLQTLEYCRKNRCDMTYVSAYIYGQPESLPVLETSSINPSNPYACSKYLSEIMCKYYSDLFGLNITVLRPFNVYGPLQREEMLIPTIISQVLRRGTNILLNDLFPKRDYIYIDDVCAALWMSVERTKGFHVFNIGSGVSYSVKDVVDKLQIICKTNKKIVSREQKRKNELSDVVADITKIQNAWGWSPSVALEDGLKKCVEWYYENNNAN